MRKYCFLSWLLQKKSCIDRLRTQLQKGFVSNEFKELYSCNKSKIEKLKKNLIDNGSSWVTFLDEEYPLGLKNLDKFPLVLSLSGCLDLLKNERKLCVVGSRKIDRGLKEWMKEEFSCLKDYTIVSGGAYGVDQEAHRNAIRKNIGTIIVLPSGLLNPYPVLLKKWFEYDLNERGVLFISQFPPLETVKKMNFHPRNQTLAALSDATLVLQAHLRSGTMVTAQYTADLGKEVYVLSCCPWDERFSGNKRLIEDGANQTIDLNLFHL